MLYPIARNHSFILTRLQEVQLVKAKSLFWLLWVTAHLWHRHHVITLNKPDYVA